MGMKEWEEAKQEVDEEDNALKKRAKELQNKKIKQKDHKKELFKTEMELMEEVKVLAEKKEEIEEFKKAHKLMVRKLEQSIRIKSQEWANEMGSLIDEVNEDDDEDSSEITTESRPQG